MMPTAGNPDKPRFVYGAMGPTTRTISVTGGLTFDELAADYHQQAAGLIEGGADVLVLENRPGHHQHQGGGWRELTGPARN